MDAVTLDALKTFGAGLDGKTLVTRFRKRRFSLSVSDRGFEYTPEHSGKPRLQSGNGSSESSNVTTRSVHCIRQTTETSL